MDLSNIYVNTQNSIRIAGSKVLYFDPINISGEQHDADIIFITHEHFDHFQPESISKIKKDSTIIIAPAAMDKQIRDEAGALEVKLCEPWTTHEIDGLVVEAVPAYNEPPKPFHPQKQNWLGYLVELDGVKYYVAGDTDVNADIRKITCDVALVPVGGKFTMNASEAAEYILEIQPKAVVPTHYGELVGNPADGKQFKELVEGSNGQIQVEFKI